MLNIANYIKHISPMGLLYKLLLAKAYIKAPFSYPFLLVFLTMVLPKAPSPRGGGGG
jgi:hypothetical protein